MSLLIWTKQEQSQVLKTLSSFLRQHKDLKIEASSDLTKLPVVEPHAGTHPLVLALGKEAIDLLSEHKVVPKGRSVTSLRSQVFPLPYTPTKVMVSYSPGISAVDHGNFVDLQCDIGMAVRYVRTGSMKPVYGKYEYVPDLKRFRAEVQSIADKTGKAVDVALDLETLGLDPYLLPTSNHPGAYIVSLQVSHTPGTAQVVYFNSPTAEIDWLHTLENAEDLAWVLNTNLIKMKGANLKYDLNWIAQRSGLTCSNFVFDTTLVGSLLDENRSNGLDVHTKIYVPELGGYSDAFDKSVDKSRMDLVHPDKLLPYAGGDADATLRVAEVEKQELLQDGALTSFYVNILHPAARAFEAVERGGCLVDLNAYKELESDLNTEIKSLVVQARNLVGGRIWAKHSDVDKVGGMNLTKASMLIDFMFSPMGLNLKPKMMTAGGKDGKGEKAPSTSMDHLIQFADVPEASEFVKLLKDYSSAAKTLNTFVSGFLNHLRSDGRYHPSYWFFAGNKDEGEGGTNTGRLSARDPAWQTIPKHTKWAKRIRRCYIAPDGYVVIERDYSQGELKVIACLANELNMIAAYLNGMDLHVATAGPFAGYNYEQMMALKKANQDLFDAIRQLGKAGNFGLIYGMGENGFYVYAVENYGVKDFSLEKAGDFRNGFFKRYPGLPIYHNRQKMLASTHKKVYSPLGRIRHLPLISSSNRQVAAQAERQAINCVDLATEILTACGWKTVNQLSVGEIIATVSSSGITEMQPLLGINRGLYEGKVRHQESSSHSSVTTPHHRWLIRARKGRKGKELKFVTSDKLAIHKGSDHAIPLVGLPLESPKTFWTDAEVEFMGWVLTDGFYLRQKNKTGGEYNSNRVGVTQSMRANPEKVYKIDTLVSKLGVSFTRRMEEKTTQVVWVIDANVGAKLKSAMPEKSLTAQVILQLSTTQRRLLIDTMLLGDGCWDEHAGRHRKFCAGKKEDIDLFSMLCVLSGVPHTISYRDMSKYKPKSIYLNNTPVMTGVWHVELKTRYFVHPGFGAKWEDFCGEVWCPTVENGTFLARRNGKVFVTGNSPTQGTLSDMLLWSSALEYKKGLSIIAPQFGACHDAGYNYVPEDKVDELVPQFMDTMENLPFHLAGWEPQLKFTADCKVGYNMADLKKWTPGMQLIAVQH